MSSPRKDQTQRYVHMEQAQGSHPMAQVGIHETGQALGRPIMILAIVPGSHRD
jgi:hypothetical protein